jgi:hypothetical protein
MAQRAQGGRPVTNVDRLFFGMMLGCLVIIAVKVVTL